MTKRDQGKYERNERDFYATPEEPILKLLPHIGDAETFAEPMCGDGAIVRVLEDRGWFCSWVSDLQPEGEMAGRAKVKDVMAVSKYDVVGADLIISNPPWPIPPNKLNGASPGSPTVPIIYHLMALRPTWLLLSSDFMHNRYFEPLAPYCTKTISVGRVSWQGNGKKGFDNAVWYKFDGKTNTPPWFIPNRAAEDRYHPSIEEILG